MMKKIIKTLTTPIQMPNLISDFTLSIPRILCGAALTFAFGADKFGMPWTSSDIGISLFEVVEWFPKDIEKYGGIFSTFPTFFAWMGGFSEAIGGLLLMLGLFTRPASFLIACTMLVAVFFEKWGGPVWEMLPALGFLWVAIYSIVLGSGKIGLDFMIYKNLSSTPL